MLKRNKDEHRKDIKKNQNRLNLNQEGIKGIQEEERKKTTKKWSKKEGRKRKR